MAKDNCDDYVLSEKDFYPPEDKRTFRDGIDDDYCEFFEEFIELGYEEGFIEDN